MILHPAFFVALALMGFLIAAFVHHKKQAREHMVCPLRARCDLVIQSEYSKFFEIPVEVLGMLYYSMIAAAYMLMAFVPEVQSAFLSFFLLCASTAAFLFSFYLIFVQAFIIKNWCTWCLGSAAVSTAIFALAVLSGYAEIPALLGEFKYPLVVLHLIGLALGFGGAMISDYLFFKFLRDRQISEGEADILGLLSTVVWTGYALLVMSGVGLFFGNMDRYLASDKFLTKMAIVAVIGLNGMLLHFIVKPRLSDIGFGMHKRFARSLRRFAFTLGAISATSWFGAALLGAVRSAPMSMELMLAGYGIAIACTIIVAQVIEATITRANER